MEPPRPVPGRRGGDDAVEDPERQGAAVEHRRVEPPYVEGVALSLLGLVPASARSRAGRPCTTWPGPGEQMYRSTSGRQTPSVSGEFATMKSIACCRLQPSAWRPVSTTSRQARMESALYMPIRSSEEE